MTVDAQGWLDGVTRRVSPNFDDRPPETVIDLLVIHGISLPPGQYGGPYIDALFCNTLDYALDPSFTPLTWLKVSAHVLIRRSGEIVQFVPFTKRAWHAGESRFGERVRCNDFSIGIELEGCDERPYEARQYSALSELTSRLIAIYPGITRDHIVGHSDIAPERKSDPGVAFDWTRFDVLLAQNDRRRAGVDQA